MQIPILPLPAVSAGLLPLHLNTVLRDCMHLIQKNISFLLNIGNYVRHNKKKIFKY